MHKKLTLTIEEDVYNGLHKVIGRRHISHFIEDLVRPQITKTNLDSSYQAMAQDETREKEAKEWTEGLIGDITHESR